MWSFKKIHNSGPLAEKRVGAKPSWVKPVENEPVQIRQMEFLKHLIFPVGFTVRYSLTQKGMQLIHFIPRDKIR